MSLSKATIEFSDLGWCLVLVFWKAIRAMTFPLSSCILSISSCSWTFRELISSSITRFFRFLASIIAMTFSFYILDKLLKIFLILLCVMYFSSSAFSSFTIVVNLVNISSIDSCSCILDISNLWAKILTFESFNWFVPSCVVLSVIQISYAVSHSYILSYLSLLRAHVKRTWL